MIQPPDEMQAQTSDSAPIRAHYFPWGRLQITEHFTHRQIDVVITGSVPRGVGGAGIGFAKLPWRLSGLHSAGRGISHADCMG